MLFGVQLTPTHCSDYEGILAVMLTSYYLATARPPIVARPDRTEPEPSTFACGPPQTKTKKKALGSPASSASRPQEAIRNEKDSQLSAFLNHEQPYIRSRQCRDYMCQSVQISRNSAQHGKAINTLAAVAQLADQECGCALPGCC